MFKEQKGITLIALVITIIVLLILAGVSIAMLGGQNGILTQSNNAKRETSRAEAVEKINLSLNAVKAKVYEKLVSDDTYTALTTAKDDVNSEIVDVMKEDLGTGTTLTKSTTAVDGKYTYSTADGVLTIRYKNAASDVQEVIGKIKLDATESADYEITKAE